MKKARGLTGFRRPEGFEPPGPLLVFLASFVVLFVEIALIRWMSAYIRLLS